MSVPGSNLLATALTAIGAQTPYYLAWTGRTLNNVGKFVDAYATAVPMAGSWQPIDRKLNKQYGLDFSKSYVTFYTRADIQPAQDDRGSDLFVYGGRRWSVQSTVGWFSQDGWNSALVVDIGPDA